MKKEADKKVGEDACGRHGDGQGSGRGSGREGDCGNQIRPVSDHFLDLFLKKLIVIQ